MPIENGTFYDTRNKQLVCKDDWVILSLPYLQKLLKVTDWPEKATIIINGQAISKMDSAGAWLLNTEQKKLEEQGHTVELQAFSDQHQELMTIIKNTLGAETPPPKMVHPTVLEAIGKQSVMQTYGLIQYLAFIGELFYEFLRIVSQPSKFRWSALSAIIYRNGFLGLPIVTLLSFMIGVVLTYQMGIQLSTYGANIFIVDLLGISILREFGPLITAIMIAGRTGSAFTAQLGMMKINQEIDALDTMGVTPGELLLIPRILGMLIALPLLTMWADIFGVFGGMVMAHNALGISFYDFLRRFPNVVPLRTLIIGLGKTQIFALIIDSIGCFQGNQVEGNANSVGQNTTKSVVMSIFFIIVADAIFSVIFSELKL